ncbi:hypothetical protein IIK_03842 [Bacillus cereus VD102]|nr:hypothetical protein IIK_03842 [Bacillus cereus VD102]
MFLFYAESRSEELNVVPMKSEEYRLGYSLETLRELEQVPLTNEAARNGYFLHESLNILFKIVNEGYGEDQYELNFEDRNFTYVDAGFDIDGLQSPLFDPKQTPLLSSVKFRNFVLQEVIQLLSLSKEGSKQRGRISYAQLGINQLGAVYEGLLSYSGFFAQETLFEVKPVNVSSTDETGQSYFVPKSEIGQYSEDEFVYTIDSDDTKIRKKYERGSFIFRLAGRDREKSASYYTPEVLTKSLVKYSLKELLKDKSADEILKLTICEPAMGSGAFLNEAVNQITAVYLERKQQEIGETISAEEYAHEKQKVKAYIATNNIYGVDLNPTAAELAKVSLWLNTIYKGSKTPWFSARLAVGNSLIGARRKVFTADDLISGKWHDKVPGNVGFTQERDEDAIYHFLVADSGMVPFDRDKIIKEIAENDVECIKEWRNEFTRKFDTSEIQTLKDLSGRIDDLWERHSENRKRLFNITQEPINLWGQSEYVDEEYYSSVDEKEEELKKIKESPTSPYRALKLIMDYWCALWFWPIEKSNLLPTRDEFLLDISVILDSAEGFGSDINELCSNVTRLGLVEQISLEQKFFSWELEFPEVFTDKNGFDLMIGNPPWIKLAWEEKGVLSDKFPILNIRKSSATQVSQVRGELLGNSGNTRSLYLKEFASIIGQKSFLTSYLYNVLSGVQTNLYKNFIVMSIDIGNPQGVVSFIHQEGIYDDAKANKLREYLYPRLKYHFHFINELMLFSDVGHPVKFGCSIFRTEDNDKISFINLSNLFHPKTIDASFANNGEGQVPGLKDKNYKWEIRGHKNRIIQYDYSLLKIINLLFEEKAKIEHTKLVNIHSTELVSVLEKLSNCDNKLSKYKNLITDTEMFHETNDQKGKNILRSTYYPEHIDELVMSGPHFFVANPVYQTPNANCKSHGDYSRVDLVNMASNFLPRTNYKIVNEESKPKWDGVPINQFSRQIFRKMINANLERTLVGAIIPKGPSHIHGCLSFAFKDNYTLVLFSGMSASLVLDFYIKVTGKSNLGKIVYNLPMPRSDSELAPYIINRVLRLNCLTEYYSYLWEELRVHILPTDRLIKNNSKIDNNHIVSEKWNREVAYRKDFERRQALIELDVLAALVLGLNIEELITIYKIQFSVLQKYENENRYDKLGRLVPGNVLKYYKKQNGDVLAEDPNLEGFILPFDKCDREADYREAYSHFSKILKENN